MKKTLLILGMALMALLAMSAGNTSESAAPAGKNSASQSRQAEIALRQTMRKLWSDHVIWTRGYIIAAVGGALDAQAAATRLLKNQEEIGAAVAEYYGKEVGDTLAGLLRQHILIAVDVINAAKANDQAKFGAENNKWKQNGQEMADFLSKANPHWPQDIVRDMMNQHLTTTLREVTARLAKKYDDDVKAFDEVYQHVLMMADALSDGIIKQFPNRF